MGRGSDVIIREDFEHHDPLLGEVVEVARDMGALHQKPQLVRLDVTLQEELIPTDKEVEYRGQLVVDGAEGLCVVSRAMTLVFRASWFSLSSYSHVKEIATICRVIAL
ncbi:hypothetical protein BHE74_00026035 [Ensete ventricosum]|nr:hypothetical protein BHE74_00026035 [Ensete ventricosum]